MESIQATLSILTRNSAATLPRALESAKDFSDILICDGGSSDATLAIAQQYGARVIAQDRKFLDADGRIVDYAGVRNQTLEVAKEKWFFFLDSDEYFSPELKGSVAAATKGPPAAYMINRLHTVGGRVAVRDITYPNRQVRFFSKEAVTHFIKPVHERIELRPHIVPRPLSGSLLVPWDQTPQELTKKWERYITLEVDRWRPVSLKTAARITISNFKIILLYTLRLARDAFCSGVRVPLSIERLWFWYHWSLSMKLWKAWLTRS